MSGKIIGFIVAPIVLFAAAVMAVTFILTMDDLQKCESVPSTIDSHCRKVDAIVAVSGGDTDARAREAIRLYKDGWAPLLIFSGAAQDKSGLSNAAAMRIQAMNAGVPAKAIIIDEQASDTAANAIGLQSIAADHQLSRIIIVTSPYHQRRASLEFSRSLGPTTTILSHATAEDRYWQSKYWWLSPYSWFLAISELTKLTYISITETTQ